MSCGGSMMRAAYQPLTHLVDAAAESWIAVEGAPDAQRRTVREEISRKFRIGENAELTFHGSRHLLTVRRDPDAPGDSTSYLIEVHQIAQSG